MSKIQVVIDGVLADRIECLAKALEMPRDVLLFKLLQDGLERNNQTEEDWVANSDFSDLGTGIFLVADVMNPVPGSVQKILVPNITYANCVQRGQSVVALKWVPHKVASYESLLGMVCSYGPADKD